jgi:hypothetical protein
MLASVDRQTALQLLETEHAAVRALIEDLTPEEMTRPDTIEYGLYPDQECSFKDLLAHLITYEVYAVEAVAAWQQGQKHWIIDAMRSPSTSRDVHYNGIACRAHLSLEAVIHEWETAQAALMQTISGLSDTAWRSPAPYPAPEPTDLGGMLEAILVAPPRPMYRHLPVHIPDSAAYVRGLRGQNRF